MKKPIITLQGGLGNQLFQYAASLYFFKASEVVFENLVARERLGKNFQPEILKFDLARQIKIVDYRTRLSYKWKLTWLRISKLLFDHFVPSNTPKIVIDTMKVFSGIVIHMLDLVLYRGSNKYFDEPSIHSKISTVTRKTVRLGGFFQSARLFDESIFDQFFTMKLLKKGSEFCIFEQKAIRVRPIIIHVRLGDYREIPTYGVLDDAYFEKALDVLVAQVGNQGIWLFSDMPDLALAKMPKKYLRKISVIPEIDGCAASTLQLMRYGSGYVISNSTFSWWSAFLRFDQSSPVICPEPWFRYADQPMDLLPNSWIRVSAWNS